MKKVKKGVKGVNTFPKSGYTKDAFVKMELSESFPPLSVTHSSNLSLLTKMGEMHSDTSVTTFVEMHQFLCFVALFFMTCSVLIDEISWSQIDPCQKKILLQKKQSFLPWKWHNVLSVFKLRDQIQIHLNEIFRLRGTAFGVFINFVNIRGLDLAENIDKWICSGTLPNKMWKILEATLKRDGKVWILQVYFAHVIILLEQIFTKCRVFVLLQQIFHQLLTDRVLILPFSEWDALNCSFPQHFLWFSFVQYTSYLLYIGFFWKLKL